MKTIKITLRSYYAFIAISCTYGILFMIAFAHMIYAGKTGIIANFNIAHEFWFEFIAVLITFIIGIYHFANIANIKLMIEEYK